MLALLFYIIKLRFLLGMLSTVWFSHKKAVRRIRDSILEQGALPIILYGQRGRLYCSVHAVLGGVLWYVIFRMMRN
jgi:hypothetical protein